MARAGPVLVLKLLWQWCLTTMFIKINTNNSTILALSDHSYAFKAGSIQKRMERHWIAHGILGGKQFEDEKLFATIGKKLEIIRCPSGVHRISLRWKFIERLFGNYRFSEHNTWNGFRGSQCRVSEVLIQPDLPHHPHIQDRLPSKLEKHLGSSGSLLDTRILSYSNLGPGLWILSYSNLNLMFVYSKQKCLRFCLRFQAYSLPPISFMGVLSHSPFRAPVPG